VCACVCSEDASTPDRFVKRDCVPLPPSCDPCAVVKTCVLDLTRVRMENSKEISKRRYRPDYKAQGSTWRLFSCLLEGKVIYDIGIPVASAKQTNST